MTLDTSFSLDGLPGCLRCGGSGGDQLLHGKVHRITSLRGWMVHPHPPLPDRLAAILYPSMDTTRRAELKPTPNAGDWYVSPRLQRVAVDVGLGAAGAAVGAEVDGTTGAVVGGAAAVAWSRLRHPPVGRE